MPQFPIQPRGKEDNNGENDLSLESEGNGVTKSKVKRELQFKRTESIGPVSRVRISESGGSTKSSKPGKRNPFKEEGLFDDKDSLVKFRDEVGRPLILALTAIAVVFLIYRYSQPSSAAAENEQAVSALLEQADQMEAQPLLTSEQFGSRMELAEQLLSFKEKKSEDRNGENKLKGLFQSVVDRGAEIKLRALSTWNTRDLESGSTDQKNRDLLESTSREFINSRNPDVSNNAKLGLTLIRIQRYLETPDAKYFPEILDQFKLVTSFAKDDLETAKKLVRIADAIQTKGLDDEAKMMHRAISIAYSSSENQNIAALGLESRNKISNENSVFEELKAMIAGAKEFKDVPWKAIDKKIGENTREDSISAGKLEAVLDFVELLIQRNAGKQSRAIIRDLSKSIYLISAGIERDSIKQRYDNLRKIVDQFGETFNYSGLYSVEGRPISRSNLNNRRAKFIVFWSPNNSRSIQIVEKISENYLKFVDQKVQLVAVATITNDKDEKDKIVEMSNKTKGIEFLTLIKGDAESQAFRSRYPLPRTPYWVLLDPADKVLAFNTSPPFLDLHAIQ